MKQNVLEVLSKLSEVPNAPFAPGPRMKFVEQFISSAGLEYLENEVAIIVKLGDRSADKKLIIMSHLDHPGFVLEDSTQGIALGTLYSEKIRNYYGKQNLPILVYGPDGKKLGQAHITNLGEGANPKVYLSADFDVPINSQALWDVEKHKVSGKKVFNISHDNDLLTAIMLSLLGEYKESKYEIHFVFNLFEELHQYSAYSLAKMNALGIRSKDIIINLESMKVENKSLDYTSGVIVSCCEKGCLYGSRYKGCRNVAEDLVNNICDNNDIAVQRGMAGGSSDARPFSEYGLTPNIITLNVPNRYKHNVDHKGRLVAEEVLIKDMNSLARILKLVLQNSPEFDEIVQNPNSLSLNAKINNYVHDKDLMSRKHLLNERLYWAYKGWVRRRHVFPESIVESLEDIVYKAFSYLVYLVVMARGFLKSFFN